MTDVERYVPVQCCLGEGPLWHPDEHALYWVDITEECFYRLPYGSETATHIVVNTQIGCMAFRAGGGLVLAVEQGIATWDWEQSALAIITDPQADNPDPAPRFNDGAVDPQGRFWAGTIAAQPEAHPNGILYRVEADFSTRAIETGVGVSNGIGWSPDHRTMYFTDSTRRVIYAYDYDPATGDISNRRDFVRLSDDDGVPDGMTVDAEGFIWSAVWDGWRVVRYDPAGKVEREIAMPVQRPTSCMFGGPDLDELFVTSAFTGLSDAQRHEQPFAGDVFRLRVGVKGLPEPFFAG